MNKDIFIDLICSYGFLESVPNEDLKEVFKYFEFRFEESEPNPELTLYWYNDDTFGLYKTEGFATVNICSNKLNIYNLKLAIEKNTKKSKFKK